MSKKYFFDSGASIFKPSARLLILSAKSLHPLTCCPKEPADTNVNNKQPNKDTPSLIIHCTVAPTAVISGLPTPNPSSTDAVDMIVLKYEHIA